MRTRIEKLVGSLACLRRDTRAGTAVEFALLVPVIIVIFLGIFEFGRAIWVQGILDYAVEQAARCASINTTTCSSTGTTQTYAAGQAAPLPNGSTSCPAGAVCPVFTATQPTSGACANENKVSATYAFSFLSIGSMPIIGASPFPTSVTLSSQSCYPI
ncbi:MAG TPA: TadE family protein [Stellaceae bacterium]|nr:TadE family protein [Stellaceae bacterium]